VLYRLASPRVFRLLRDLQALAQDQVADVGRLVQLYYDSPDELEPVTCAELEQRLESDRRARTRCTSGRGVSGQPPSWCGERAA
jgi:hypothetical protein